MFAVEARLAGARVVDLPRTDPACRQPATEIRALAEREAARLVWLCTPNNPTGDRLPTRRDPGAGRGPAGAGLRRRGLSRVRRGKHRCGAGLHVGHAAPGRASRTCSFCARSRSRTAWPAREWATSSLPDAAGRAIRRDPPAALGRLAVGGDRPRRAGGRGRGDATGDGRSSTRATGSSRLLGELGCEVLPSVTNSVAFRPTASRQPRPTQALLARGVAVRRYEIGPMAGWLRATARLEPEEGAPAATH